MLDSLVNTRTFEQMKSFVKDFVLQLDINSGQWRVGGLTFDFRARADFHLNRYNFKSEIISAVDKLRSQSPGGYPAYATAFDYVRRNMFTSDYGDRSNARNFVILLTGNERSLNHEQSYAAANRLKDTVTDVFTIGINFRNSSELDAISSKPLNEYRTLTNSADGLRKILIPYKSRMDSVTSNTVKSTITVPRQISFISTYKEDCKSKGDVIFVLDSSGSVGELNFALMKNFTFSTVRDLEIDSGFFRVGIISFSDTSRIDFHLNTYTTKREIYDAVERINYVYGHTHTAEALRRVRTEMFTSRNGDRLDVPNVLVVVTDGQSNVNNHETLPEARELKSIGVTIISVAIGLEDQSELRGLTSPPVEDNLIEVSNFEDLRKLSHLIVKPLCSDANLCDADPCKNGGQCIDGLRSYMCVCLMGFYGDNCENPCGPPADVVFILDSSSSIGAENFDNIKIYAQTLVRQMNILSCDIHVGVIKYSSSSMIQFNLDAHSSLYRIIRAIQGISYTPGRSNMADALRVVRSQMFTVSSGDRQNVHNIAFLLTDGSVEINSDITSSEIELTIDAGILVIPLAVGLRDRTELEYLAEAQGISLIEIEDADSFLAMSDQVLKSVHDNNNRCHSNPCFNGAQCVSAPKGFSCVCPLGFVGDLCNRACNSKADVVFAVDASRYNTELEFRTIRKFLRDVIKRISFREDSLRIGIVEYGMTPRVILSLLDGDNKETVVSVITALRRHDTDPHLENAVKLADYGVFHRSGDRKEVPNYLVVVTRSVANFSTVQAFSDLKSKGTKIIGIGMNLSSKDQNYLKESVSSPTNQTLFIVDTVDALDRMSAGFFNFDNLICEEKNMCTRNPCQNGGVCQNGTNTFICKCKPGYAGNDCSRTCQDKADVVFLIDSSGSVGFENLQQIKTFVHHVVDGFNIGPEATKVGVASFSQGSRAEIYLNSFEDKASLQNAVSSISYTYGNTNTASGITLVHSSLFAYERGNRPDVPDYLIIITDGLSNINHEATIPEAEYVRQQGIHIFAIGVGVGDLWELNGIASKPSDRNVFQIRSWDGLLSISDELIDRTCLDSGVCDENPCMHDGTCIAGIGTFSCQCLNGFVGNTCELDCQENKDIVFILDASESVGQHNFELMLKFVSTIVKDLTVYGQEHYFSLITYSTDVKTIFSFNRYRTVEKILEAIQTTKYTSGSTNTAGGLRQAAQLFQEEFGDRPSAKNVAILMTDGQSNVNYWDTVPAATKLKATRVQVITVGINLENSDEINNIASSRKDVFVTSSFRSLDSVKINILERSCSSRE
uniref:Uncharacterized protein n=1 Tax=Arion vulgaris TaxID=1028688 RepID=A0A0B7BC59_9EUPU